MIHEVTPVFIPHCCDHAKQYNKIPIVTFDQPMWWKALSVIQCEPEGSDLRNFALRLGGFHTIMSLLGCIGHIMEGSSLQSVLELIHASNTVTHMLSEKPCDRVSCGHLIVVAALNTILASTAQGIPLSSLSEVSSSQQTEGIIHEMAEDTGLNQSTDVEIDIREQVFQPDSN